jgi:hypothetical protein
VKVKSCPQSLHVSDISPAMDVLVERLYSPFCVLLQRKFLQRMNLQLFVGFSRPMGSA